MRNLVFTLCVASMLSGCATVSTTPVSSLISGEGIEYALPTREFVLEVREADGSIAATLVGPVVRQDNGHRYRTRLLSSGIATNDFTIEINNRGLLTSFSGSSEGKLTDIAKAAARTVAYQGAEVPNAKLVFSIAFSLADISAAQDKANQRLGAYVQTLCAEKTDKGAETASCTKLRASLVRSRGQFIRLSSETIADLKDTGNPHPPPRNTNVLFYRPLISVRMTVELGDGQAESKIFAIPDDRRANWVAISGGVFAKQEYELTFTDGVLTKHHRIARNEVVGAISLPVEVAKSLVAAPFEALNDRKAGLDSQAAYLTSAAALQTAAASAEKACQDSGAVCRDLPIQSMTISNALAEKATTPAQRGTTDGDSNVAGNGNNEGT